VNEEVTALVHKTSIVSATIGVVLSPVPLLDELVLIPVFAAMTKRIARAHAIDRVPWKPIAKSTAVGLVARGLVNIAFVAIPGVSTAVDAATAAALTEVLGKYVDETCADPAAARTLKVREVMGMLKAAAQAARLRKKPVAA
jgi:uncharacterized protein (DUF697 family)